MINEKRQETIKAGELFILSSGEFSNYGPIGCYKALKDINPDSVKDMYFATDGKEVEYEYQHESRFVNYLEKNGLVERVFMREFHLGWNLQSPTVSEITCDLLD